MLQTRTAILLSAAMLLAPAVLPAQFTTFVAPPQKATAQPKPTPAVAKAKADSVSRMTLTDMKAWVDSAAGTGTQVANVSDTTIAAATSALPPATANVTKRRSTTSFSNGAIAPNTATPLPTILLGGLGCLVLGGFLLRRRRPA